MWTIPSPTSHRIPALNIPTARAKSHRSHPTAGLVAAWHHFLHPNVTKDWRGPYGGSLSGVLVRVPVWAILVQIFKTESLVELLGASDVFYSLPQVEVQLSWRKDKMVDFFKENNDIYFKAVTLMELALLNRTSCTESNCHSKSSFQGWKSNMIETIDLGSVECSNGTCIGPMAQR